jgi:hypothetical protein
MCVVSWFLMATTVYACVGGEFLLQWRGRGSMGAVVAVALSLITFVTAFVNGGYLWQNVKRDESANSNGIHAPPGEDKHYIERGGENA